MTGCSRAFPAPRTWPGRTTPTPGAAPASFSAAFTGVCSRTSVHRSPRLPAGQTPWLLFKRQCLTPAISPSNREIFAKVDSVAMVPPASPSLPGLAGVAVAVAPELSGLPRSVRRVHGRDEGAPRSIFKLAFKECHKNHEKWHEGHTHGWRRELGDLAEPCPRAAATPTASRRWCPGQPARGAALFLREARNPLL